MKLLTNTHENLNLFGVQTPRIRNLPAAQHSLGDAAIELAASFGLILDPWQQNVLNDALLVKDDNPSRWAAFEVGLVVSRQNGKGAILEARELAGALLFGEQLIVHSAHEFKTAKEAMRRLEMLLARAGEPYRANRSHGEESLEFKKTGARVMFQTRTKAAGRGLSGDLIILDEAMILSSDAVGALLPTMSARPNPQLWYTGSAVDQAIHANGTVFASVRERGLSAADPSLCWQEWSCVPGADLDDAQQYAISNPGLGYRIQIEHVRNERRALSHQPKVFSVERMSIGDWPALGDVDSQIPADAWSEMMQVSPELVGPRTIAVHRSRDRRRWAVAAAQRTVDNRVHIEVGPVQEGSHTDVAEYLVDKIAQWNPLALVMDRRSSAMALEPLLLDAGIEPTITNSTDLALACGGFLDDALSGMLSHSNQQVLTSAASNARKRELPGGGFAWHEDAEGSTTAPLIAATLAHWALISIAKPPTGPRSAPVVEITNPATELDVFAAF